METSSLLYIPYLTKLGVQFGVHLLFLDHPESPVIKYLASSTALLAVSPVFHTILHLCGKPISRTLLVAYCCFSTMLAILWYPTMIETGNILDFILVTVLDGITVFIYLLAVFRQWHLGSQGKEVRRFDTALLETQHSVSQTEDELRPLSEDCDNNDGTQVAPSQSTKQNANFQSQPDDGLAECNDQSGDNQGFRSRDTAIYAPFPTKEYIFSQSNSMTQQRRISWPPKVLNHGARGDNVHFNDTRYGSLPCDNQGTPFIDMNNEVHPALRSPYRDLTPRPRSREETFENLTNIEQEIHPALRPSYGNLISQHGSMVEASSGSMI